MAQAVFSVRMDETLKRDFSAFCENVGMNMSTAIVIFAKTVVRERQFPFAISERPVMGRRNRTDEIDNQARLAVEHMRQQVEASNAKEPSMDEINAFISTARTRHRKVVKNSNRTTSLFETLRSCPFGGVELNIERDHGLGREVAFA